MTIGSQLSSLLATLESAVPSFTLFEVADGHRLLGPPVDGVAALLVLNGTMYLEEEGGHRAVPAGRLVLMPPGRRAILTATPEPAGRTVDGRRSLIDRHGWLVADATDGEPASLVVGAARIQGSAGHVLDGPVVTAITECPVAKPIFSLLRAEHSRGPQGHPALAMTLMSVCVVQGLRQAIETARAEQPGTDTVARSLVGRAVAAIRARPGEAHTVDTLADIAGMSRSTFIRHFRRVMRMSPIEYVQRVRLDEARAMLGATDLPVKTVAARAGFASRSHFSRLFRSAFGADPTAFRQQAGAQSIES